MKIFIVLACVLAITMSHAVPMVPLSNALLLDGYEDSQVRKEINFDQELQKLNLTSFRTLLKKAKLFDILNDPTTSYTVFAPTNTAITKAAGVLSNATRLPEILSYHVHLGAFRTNMIQKDMRLKTLLHGEKKIRFEFYSGAIYGSCKPMGSPRDQTYDNGILDVFNGVMVPPEGNVLDFISQGTTFETLQKYVSAAGSVQKRFLQTKDPITYLAPNDAAFKKLTPDVVEKLNNNIKFLRAVLNYHALTDIYCSAGFENGQEVPTYEGASIKVQVSGGKVVLNNSTVIEADIIAYNGVVHVIDTVLLPPQFL